MKILCKISLALSIIFLSITVLITLMCSFFDYYVIIGNLGTSQLLAIPSSLSILFFAIFILAKRIRGNLFVIVSIVFLASAEVILLLVAFLPEYKYATHVSNDNAHTVVVEEKSTATEVSIQFYKKVFGAAYEPVYCVMFTGNQKDTYKFGDYIVSFDDKHTNITVPLSSSTAFQFPHSN